MKSIDDILAGNGGEEEVAPAQEQAIETEAQQADPDIARDEKGRFAPKGVDDGAPPAPTDRLPPEEYKALKEERTKRQTLEQELAQITQRLQQIEAAPKEPPAPPPSIWEDEQGALQHFGSQVMQQATVIGRLQTSEMLMHQAHPDFGEMQKVFVSMLEQSPQLRETVMADPHPWNKAYQIAKNHKTMQELGATDVETLKSKLREELLAEIATQPAKPGLPVSIAGERNVGQRTGPAWSGPPSLNDILNQ